MLKRTLTTVAGLWLIFPCSSAVSQPVRWISPSFEFRETGTDTPNPDRGMFNQIRVDNTLRIGKIDGKERNVRIYFVINKFIDEPIPSQELDNLSSSLSSLERSSQRAVVRFIYDYPSDDFVKSGMISRPARTAASSIMSIHIRQLAGVLKLHKRSVFAVESGLIGFWGEQHGDTPDKQTPAGVVSVINQWRTALAGSEIEVLARYPKMISEYLVGHSDLSSKQPELGFWNDCLGAYDDGNVDAPHTPVVEGETCALQPRIDYSCSIMEPYFKAVQLDLLHSEYFLPTLNRWRAEGCFPAIQRSIGYRYVVRDVRLSLDGSQIALQIDNVGWGRSLISRPLYLVANGRRIRMIADLKDFLPGSKNHLSVRLETPLNLTYSKLSLETDDGVQFSDESGNLLYIPTLTPGTIPNE